MRPLQVVLDHGLRLNLRAVRSSQALVIAGLSRVVHAGPARGRKILSGAAEAQLDVIADLVGDPDRFVDSVYAHAQQLVALHQEFIHRVLEAVDADDGTTSESRGPVAKVIPLVSA